MLPPTRELADEERARDGDGGRYLLLVGEFERHDWDARALWVFGSLGRWKEPGYFFGFKNGLLKPKNGCQNSNPRNLYPWVGRGFPVPLAAASTSQGLRPGFGETGLLRKVGRCDTEYQK